MTSASPTSNNLLAPSAALAIIAALIATQAFVLHQMGHSVMCPCGSVKLWFGDIQSRENSQHITDWYTFSHIIHGFIFYGLTHILAPRLSLVERLLLAVAIEAGWEILENSPIIIDRYRSE